MCRNISIDTDYPDTIQGHHVQENPDQPGIGLGRIEVKDTWIADFDITYFLTDYIAVELV